MNKNLKTPLIISATKIGPRTSQRSNKDGFTLVEVLVSLSILLVFIPFAASMLTNSRLLASYSKHRTEAAYAAQQILETQRQSAFVVLAAGKSSVIGPNAVVLDTKGNYNNTSCNNSTAFCGTAVITITPAVYTNNAGVKTTSSTVDHVLVVITWIEQIVNLKIAMTEAYTEDIINDPVLN